MLYFSNIREILNFLDFKFKKLRDNFLPINFKCNDKTYYALKNNRFRVLKIVLLGGTTTNLEHKRRRNIKITKELTKYF